MEIPPPSFERVFESNGVQPYISAPGPPARRRVYNALYCQPAASCQYCQYCSVRGSRRDSIRGQHIRYPRLPASTRGPLRPQIFDDFLTSSWYLHFLRFWCQLGPNLAPNLAPKSPPNRSKSLPKSIQNRILFSIAFWIDFGSILGRFSTPKSIKNRPKINQQISPTTQQPKIKKVAKT